MVQLQPSRTIASLPFLPLWTQEFTRKGTGSFFSCLGHNRLSVSVRDRVVVVEDGLGQSKTHEEIVLYPNH